MKKINLITIFTVPIVLFSCTDNTITNQNNKADQIISLSTDTTGCDCALLEQQINAFGNVIENESHIFYLDGKKYTGSCYTLQNDGKSNREVRNYKNGLLDGVYIKWYDNKQINIKTNLIYGLENGLYEEYTENGKLISKINFKNGMPYGFNYNKVDSKYWNFTLNNTNELSFNDLKYEYQYNNYLTSGSGHKLAINKTIEFSSNKLISKYLSDDYRVITLGRDFESISEKEIKSFVNDVNSILSKNNNQIHIAKFYFGDPIMELNKSTATDVYVIDKVRIFNKKHIYFLDLLSKSKHIILSEDLKTFLELAKNGREQKVVSNTDEEDDIFEYLDE